MDRTSVEVIVARAEIRASELSAKHLAISTAEPFVPLT